MTACPSAASDTALHHFQIFDTDCKKGLPGRGLQFLEEVCGAVHPPVYAIGGITPENLLQALSAGAAEGCMMSLAMRLQG